MTKQHIAALVGAYAVVGMAIASSLWPRSRRKIVWLAAFVWPVVLASLVFYLIGVASEKLLDWLDERLHR